MEDIFKTITEERVNRVAKRWDITQKDAYELIVNVESRQNIPVLSIVINPYFSTNDVVYSNNRVNRNNTVKKKSFFSFLFKCCR